MVQALNAPHSELRTVREVVLEFVPGRASGGMVDALASGASARKGVEVQLLSRARIGSPVSAEAGAAALGGLDSAARVPAHLHRGFLSRRRAAGDGSGPTPPSAPAGRAR